MTVKEFNKTTNIPDWKINFVLLTDKGEKPISFAGGVGWVDDETFDGTDAEIIIPRYEFPNAEVIDIIPNKIFTTVKVRM